MKKSLIFIILFLFACSICCCKPQVELPQVAATTLPVYEFTARLCSSTDIAVGQVVTESVSCLHDYSLQTGQLRMLEGAELVIINGAGLEDFLPTEISSSVVDASEGIELSCPSHHHDEHGHHHEHDPHIWLSPENAAAMAGNICGALCNKYPAYTDIFLANLETLSAELQALESYGQETLNTLSCRELITFHDGFSYLAEAFDLTILHAVEEESGSEASAAELIELVELVKTHHLPAIFVEQNGSVSAADIVTAEAGVPVYTLDMAMGGGSYFDSMYHNIDTIKEALG